MHHRIDYPHLSPIARKQIKSIDVSIIWYPNGRGMKVGGEPLHGGNWSWRGLFWGVYIVLSSAAFLSSQGFQKWRDFIVTCAHDQLFCLSQDCWNGKGSHGVEHQKPPSLLQAASHGLSRALVTLKELKRIPALLISLVCSETSTLISEITQSSGTGIHCES